MKIIRRMIAVAVASTALACVPALGQTDLLHRHDTQTDIRAGVYWDTRTGNQDTVREFDGRKFDFANFELLNVFGYRNTLQYWLDGRDLSTNCGDVSLNLGIANELSLNMGTTSLRHRYARTPGLNPYLVPLGLSTLDPGPPAVVTGDAFVDLTPGNELGIDRRVNNIGLRITPGMRNLAFNARWWQESERGLKQVTYRSNARRLESQDVRIDRSTEEVAVGADAILGSAALSCSLESNSFSEDAGTPLVGDRPANTRIPDVHTSSSVVKARAKLSDKMRFTGVFIDRNRKNKTTSLVADKGIDIRSTSGGLTYTASNVLTLTGRYRRYELDNHLDPYLGTGTTPQNVALDRSESSLALDADYSGIPKALVSVGFERRTAERTLDKAFPENEELREMASPKTTSDILSLRFRYNPFWRLSLNGKIEGWDNADPEYKGSPARRTKMNASAAYMATDRLAFYADYNSLKDRRRSSEGMDSRFSSTVLGTWYGLGPKLTLDAYYGIIRSNASTLWELGDPLSEEVPYDSRDKQWSIGLDFAASPRMDIYGRYFRSIVDGHATVSSLVPGNPDLPEGWMPVNVRENRWTLGFTHNVSKRDRLALDLSLARWKDRVDPHQNGRYGLWRVTWATTI